jgi:tetratricopeptide (TPR) repeat protein
MRNLRQITVCSCLFISFSLSANRQSAEHRKMERRAETHYMFSEYDEALPIFMHLLEKDPGNASLCYRIGICYYYSSTSRPLSVPYFERALRLPGITKSADLYLHAGLAYLSLNRFSDARSSFELFRSKAEASYDPAVAIRMLAYCDNGEKAWKNPAHVRVRNLGKNVNSAYPDYAPVLAQDENCLLFTSKRPGTTGGRKDENGFYFEDIYQSKNMASGRWGESGRYDIGPVRYEFPGAEDRALPFFLCAR